MTVPQRGEVWIVDLGLAAKVFLARTSRDKQQIRQEITDRFGYDLNRTIEDIRPRYSFDLSCQGTVPEAIIAFLDSISYEDAVRNAISLGGDSDTLACITGGIAEAFYGGIPSDIRTTVQERLTPDLWRVAEEFCRKYGIEKSNQTSAGDAVTGTPDSCC